jgi:AAA-like domain
LVMLHGLDWPEPEVVQVMDLIGGHPYLVRSVLYHIAAGDLTLAEWLRTAATEAGIYRNHLVGHLKLLEDYPALGTAMKMVVTTAGPVRLRAEEAFKLDSMGLVVRVENKVQPRCRLYRQYFRDRLGA